MVRLFYIRLIGAFLVSGLATLGSFGVFGPTYLALSLSAAITTVVIIVVVGNYHPDDTDSTKIALVLTLSIGFAWWAFCGVSGGLTAMMMVGTFIVGLVLGHAGLARAFENMGDTMLGRRRRR